jgi:hypothetical protein
MQPDVFQKYWNHNFDLCPPIGHMFKVNFSANWFRIHNLPEAKRYATNKDEHLEILYRQNTLLEELSGTEGTRIFLVTGVYGFGDEPSITLPLHSSFAPYNFEFLEQVDLHAISHQYYDKGIVYYPAYALTEWRWAQHDPLLQAIANDELRAFFILPVSKIMFAPYDGGVDIIVFDEERRKYIKEKYKAWLSEREDGL